MSSTAHWWYAVSPVKTAELGIEIDELAVPVALIVTKFSAVGVAYKSQPGAPGSGTPALPVEDKPETKMPTEDGTPSASDKL